MTDITELAQRLATYAKEDTYPVLSPADCGALVEALEKAQQPVVPPMQHWEELCREHPDMSIGDAIIRAAWWNHCRAAMLQAGNSPVIPGGYVMVPKEPTKEMIDAGWLHFMGTKNPSSKGTYKAMLAAAEQEVPDGK
ncbi:hypothetical protein HA444_07555 [Klebsiella grimontii]|uniref:hypothetical protein n=1 Tax=Klebsiella grimontii TaxID=2058152 RepID=UPI001667884D|nr:hypothetical protein [Klebsiella grimontii]MBD0902472.1 hypothetical protein [Klebsiella grimontii]